MKRWMKMKRGTEEPVLAQHASEFLACVSTALYRHLYVDGQRGSVPGRILSKYTDGGKGKIHRFGTTVPIMLCISPDTFWVEASAQKTAARMKSSSEQKERAEILTECVHELVVALLPVGSSVGHGVAVWGGLAEGPGGVVLAVAAAAVVAAPRGAG